MWMPMSPCIYASKQVRWSFTTLQNSSLYLGVWILYEFASYLLSISIAELELGYWIATKCPLESAVLTLGRLLHLSGTGYLHLDLQLTMLVAGILKFGTKIVTTGKARVYKMSLPTLNQQEAINEIWGKYLAAFRYTDALKFRNIRQNSTCLASNFFIL